MLARSRSINHGSPNLLARVDPKLGRLGDIAAEVRRVKASKAARARWAKAGPPRGYCDACGSNAGPTIQDYDAATGRKRGRVCFPCLTAIVNAAASVCRLVKLARYLRDFGGAR